MIERQLKLRLLELQERMKTKSKEYDVLTATRIDEVEHLLRTIVSTRTHDEHPDHIRNAAPVEQPRRQKQPAAGQAKAGDSSLYRRRPASKRKASKAR